MRGLATFLLLLAFLNAGCSEPPVSGASPVGAGPDGEDEAATNATAAPILWPAHDPWGTATETVLYEGDVPIECATTSGALVNCAGGSVPIGEVPFLVEGTMSLRVEADATDALKTGGYYAYLVTPARDEMDKGRGEPSLAPVAVWDFDIKPLDWDYAYRGMTVARLGFLSADDPPSVLHGSIRTKVTAVRDPDWRPAPVLDAWEGNASLVGADAMVLADVNTTWNGVNLADSLGQAREYPEDVPLRPIPPGTKSLVLAVTWVETDCPEGHDCAPNPGIGRGTEYYPEGVAERSAQHLLVTYAVPGDIPDDGPNATASGAVVQPFVWRCTEAMEPTGLGCFAAFFAFSASVDLRVHVEAWRVEPDLAAVKARMGITG